MSRVVVLLRGVNLVKRNRISMPDLRTALTHAGFADVATYVQSGNVVLTSTSSPEGVASKVRSVIAARFGLELFVLARSADELAEACRESSSCCEESTWSSATGSRCPTSEPP